MSHNHSQGHSHGGHEHAHEHKHDELPTTGGFSHSHGDGMYNRI